MKKTFKLISILLVFLLIFQISIPISQAHSNLVLEKIKSESNISEDELNLTLELISQNQSTFLMDINQEALKSQSNNDLNLSLLRYYSTLYSNSRDYYSSSELVKEDEIQPFVGFVVRLLIQNAVKKKMGGKIAKQIGKEVDNKVVPKAQDAAEKAYKKNAGGSTKSKGPEQAGAPNNISQGERIIELLDKNNKPYFRLDVYKNPAGNTTNWHWHLKEDKFVGHYGNIKLQHNSLPKWGAE